MLNQSDLYLAPNVSRSAVNRFFEAFLPEKNEIHAIEIHHKGSLVLRVSPAPYSCSDKREIYSLSKSFCSTAVGFLIDEEKLDLDARIVDLFPEYVPENPQPGLLKMKVRHVMSMNSGHGGCAMPGMIRAGSRPEDEIRSFMEQPIPYEPGTHFAYNTGATLVLSHIVERITGMKLLDFLTWKLFMPLGISDIRWNRTPDGANEGGCGIHVSVDDISKLGLLYLNRGVWNGTRLLSEKWVAEATSPISDNSMNGSPDWCSGYGFQFWVNAREGFRGDGAFGQLCVVCRPKNLVFACTSQLNCDFQTLMDALYEYLVDPIAEEALPESADEAAQAAAFAAEAAALTCRLPEGTDTAPAGVSGNVYELSPNRFGVKAFSLRFGETDTLTADTDAGSFTLPVGHGAFLEGETAMAPREGVHAPFWHEAACAGAWQDGKYRLAVLYTRTTTRDDVVLEFCPHGVRVTVKRVGCFFGGETRIAGFLRGSTDV